MRHILAGGGEITLLLRESEEAKEATILMSIDDPNVHRRL